MTDAALVWDAVSHRGDLAIDAGAADLAADDGLSTAVLVSLFTDRRTAVEELPDGETRRRGWWGDTLSPDDEIGSHLWLLARAKRTPDTLHRAEDYARAALGWLVEDGVAEEVAVRAEDREGRLLIHIDIRTAGRRVALEVEAD